MYKVSVIGNYYDPSKLCCVCRISATKLQANRKWGWLGCGDSWTGDQKTSADTYFSIRSTPLLLLPTLISVSVPPLYYFYPLLFQYQFHPCVTSTHSYFSISSTTVLVLLPSYCRSRSFWLKCRWQVKPKMHMHPLSVNLYSMSKFYVERLVAYMYRRRTTLTPEP